MDFRGLDHAQVVHLGGVVLQDWRVARHSLVRQWQGDGGVIQFIVSIPKSHSLSHSLETAEAGQA